MNTRISNTPPAGKAQAAQAGSGQAWRQLHHAACEPYKQSGRFAWHWARGKLKQDPVFKGMLQRGDLPPRARVVDIGCGQGLLASLLMACEVLQEQGHWPAGWPAQASASAYTGIELMAKDVARARTALEGSELNVKTGLQPQFVCADMREAAIPACDLVVILDVLHYVEHAAQDRLLQRVFQALPAGSGRLLLRVGDAEAKRGFAISQWVDHVVTLTRGHQVPPTWGRPLPRWRALLAGLGFEVHCVPQSQGTPFANVLLVADKRA